MEAVQSIYYLMPIAMAVVGLVAWLVRLDAKVRALEANHDNLDLKHETISMRLVNELSSVRESLARIEGKMQAHWDRND